MIIDIKLLDGHWPVSDEARRLKEGGFTNSNFGGVRISLFCRFRPFSNGHYCLFNTEVIIRHNIYRMILQNRTFFLRMNNAPLNSLVSCTTITKPVFTSDLVPFTTNRLPLSSIIHTAHRWHLSCRFPVKYRHQSTTFGSLSSSPDTQLIIQRKFSKDCFLFDLNIECLRS